MRAQTISKILHNPLLAIRPLAERGFLNWMSDSQYLSLLYRSQFGRSPDLEHPQKFTEKIQWLKIHDRNPEYIKWVDKISAKEMARSFLGERYAVPLLKCWNKAEEINFDGLPEICVLKCNHDQGSTVIYRRNLSNEDSIRYYFRKRLNKNPYSTTREWPYSQIKPQILCEPYLSEEIFDYKFFCFNGEPKIINIGQKSEIDKQTRVSFLDLDWKFMPFQRSDFKRIESLPPKPECLDELMELARKLSKGTKFVRTDFFVIERNIYFSEFTLYPTSGLIQFEPEEADIEVGSWLEI